MRRKRVFLIVTMLYILDTIFPLFADLLTIPVWLPSLGAFLVMLILYPSAFANKTMVYFVIYALLLSIYLFAGRPLTIGIGTVADRRKILIEFAFILPTLSIFSVLYYLKDISLTKRIVMWSVVILYVSFVIAVPLMLQYNSLREALDLEGDELGVPGLPGYSLMHAYTLFLPTICYATKKFKGKRKLWFMLALCALCFVVYDTFVTASLLIMIALLIFTLFYSERNSTHFWGFFGIGAGIFIILYEMGFFILLIDWIYPLFRGTPVAGKLIDIQTSMYMNEVSGGNLVTRQEMHAISWASFFENPIWGTSVVGRHSVLIDRLGGMGIVVFFPFLMMIITALRRHMKAFYTRTSRMFFMAGIIAGFLFMYGKGIWGSESWLMFLVLMPFGLQVFERENNDGRIVA